MMRMTMLRTRKPLRTTMIEKVRVSGRVDGFLSVVCMCVDVCLYLSSIILFSALLNLVLIF